VITTRIPARPTPPAKPATVLPFTMRDIVVFLSTTFQITPIESGPDYAKFIYMEDWAGSGEEIMRIAVAARDEQLRVAFTFHEFNAMPLRGGIHRKPALYNSRKRAALRFDLPHEHGWKQIGRFHARAGSAEYERARKPASICGEPSSRLTSVRCPPGFVAFRGARFSSSERQTAQGFALNENRRLQQQAPRP
jgi:hypothetical protein